METNREEPQALYRDFQELSSETLERPPGSRRVKKQDRLIA